MGGARSAVVGQKRATATFQSEGPCTAYSPNKNAAGVARFKDSLLRNKITAKKMHFNDYFLIILDEIWESARSADVIQIPPAVFLLEDPCTAYRPNNYATGVARF